MELHPLNKTFQWQEAEGPFRLISDEQARSWNEKGYFLLEGAFDTATLSDLIADIDPIEAKMEDYLRKQYGGTAFIARAGRSNSRCLLSTRRRSA